MLEGQIVPKSLKGQFDPLSKTRFYIKKPPFLGGFEFLLYITCQSDILLLLYLITEKEYHEKPPISSGHKQLVDYALFL